MLHLNCVVYEAYYTIYKGKSEYIQSWDYLYIQGLTCKSREGNGSKHGTQILHHQHYFGFGFDNISQGSLFII